MPFDLFVYHDMDDPQHDEPPSVGEANRSAKSSPDCKRNGHQRTRS
jgi:hypothetical protein